MRTNPSLALRLFASSATIAMLVLLVAGIGLSSLYAGAVERAFDRRLGVYVKALVADVATIGEGIGEVGDLGEPLFGLPLSGWYWQVTRLGAVVPEVRSSRSLFDRELPRLETLGVPQRLGGARVGYAIGPGEQRLRISERQIDLGDGGRFLISVGGNSDEIATEIHEFNLVLWVTFVLLGIGLVMTAAVQVYYGLRPLKAVRQALGAIRSGSADRIIGDFPREIAPLVREMNALIDANREIVERARTQAGNLAHALKTPLSVLLNEAAVRDDPLAAKVREQIDIMRDQVARHLDRARVAARAANVASATDVAPVVHALVRTMGRIYADRNLAFGVAIDRDVRFRGERHDLEEMLGNLIDNAAKWAQGRVEVEVLAEATSSDLDRRFLRIIIDDDGPGLTADQREAVMKRGRRLDETKPGSGLGLSIVVETASVHGGRLGLGTAPIGGLRAELVLPSA